MTASADLAAGPITEAMAANTPATPAMTSASAVNAKPSERAVASIGDGLREILEERAHARSGLADDAEVREDISMREAGHASRHVHARYNHPMIQAHQAAAEQVAELVRKAGGAS